jgi:sister chromatid cohesion protein PDS5
MAPRQSNVPQGVALKFNEQLSWKAGKPIPVTTLIKRLKTLSQELKGLDQEDVDRESLNRAAKELCSQGLLSHKDKGVKAYTACCLADMLRLYAPDAPYTLNQLKVFWHDGIKSVADKDRTSLTCLSNN